MLWTLSGMADLLKCGLTEPGEFSIKNLTGKGIGGKGTVRLMMIKHQCMEHLAHGFADEVNLDKATKDALNTMLEGHESARVLIGGPNHTADRTWVSLLPNSGQLIVRFATENVFGLVNDWAWKAAMKGGKGARDALDQAPFQSLL